MWIFTPDGFYSVVQKPQDRKRNTLTVRARNREDIDALVANYFPRAKPWRLDHSDYEWRIRVSKRAWARAVAKMAEGIDYSNFKDEVGRRQGKDRAGVYSRIWGVLLGLEAPGRFKGSYELEPEEKKPWGWWPKDEQDTSYVGWMPEEPPDDEEAA